MAFPWDNLITGVSTLTAGLGAVGLKQRGDRKVWNAEASRQDATARADRLNAAYADLVKSAMDMQLHFGQMVAIRRQWTAEHPECVARARGGEETGRQLLRALSIVQLIGSPAAREASRSVHNATTAAFKTLEPREVDREAADTAAKAMFDAIDSFVGAVRPETAESAAGPIRQRRWYRPAMTWRH